MKCNIYRSALKSCLIIMLLVSSSCKKLIEFELPIDKSTSKTVFNDVGSAAAVFSGIYLRLERDMSGNFGISETTGLYSDEFMPPYDLTNPYYINMEGADGFWSTFYGDEIYDLNSIIEGVSSSDKITDEKKNILLAEARFTRAFLYFYLVNFYGDVPLVLSTNYEVNSNISRSSVSDVYNKIIEDLDFASQYLNDDYKAGDLVNNTEDRVRPTKPAAQALLARVYLFDKNWTLAEFYSTQVIDNLKFELLTDPDQVFLKNSREAIWQIQPTNSEFNFEPNTNEGKYYVPRSGDQVKIAISDALLTDMSVDDLRRIHWTLLTESGTDRFYIPYKYKAGSESSTQTEYFMILRLAEQYLIRAEARAELGNIDGALKDLNMIRERAGLSSFENRETPELLKGILKEKRVEMFGEMGLRWLDIKRSNSRDQLMANIVMKKGGTWSPYKALFPIPFLEFNSNIALRGHQNPGYQEPSY